MDQILYDVQGTTGVLTLNRPEAHNALTFDMYERISEICNSIELGGPLRALVLVGAGGKAFASGTEIAQFRSFARDEDALSYEAMIENVLNAIECCPVPTIAAVTGATTGGGAIIAAACDMRIGDPRLRFGFPIAKTLGNCLSGRNLNRIASLIGVSRLRELLLTARLMDAAECLSAGFVMELQEDADAARNRSLQLADGMTHLAPLSLQAAKEGLRRLQFEGPQAKSDDLILQCYMSEDFQEGVDAFLEKRQPDWKAR